MADPAMVADRTGDDRVSDPAVDDRGSLVIHPRAVTRIAEAAARHSTGSIAVGATLGKGLPKATVRIAGDHVRINVDLAIAWGNRFDTVAATARDGIAARVAELTGLTVDAVDVHVAGVAADTTVGAVAGTERPSVAKSPAKRPGSVLLIGAVIAVAVGALGVLGIRDGLQAAGVVDGRSWSAWLADRLAVLVPAAWMTPIGIAAVVVGLGCLTAALKRRRRRELAIGDESDTWLRRRDVNRLATDTAASVGSVVSASARTRRRRVTVFVTTTGDRDRVEAEVDRAVAGRLDQLRPVTAIRTAVRVEGG